MAWLRLLLVLVAVSALAACGDDDYSSDASNPIKDLSGTAAQDLSTSTD